MLTKCCVSCFVLLIFNVSQKSFISTKQDGPKQDFFHVLQYQQCLQEIKEFTQILGKNIFLFTKQLHAAIGNLDEVGTVPDENYGDSLHGFIKFSNESSTL